MIPQKNTVTVENFGGSVTKSMGIDSSSIAHVMRVLSKLYSDPVLAVIREYSTNAMDSHIAAGKPNLPIEVSLPNKDHPVLSITDYGTGLNEDEVYNIYGMYGASTKRESNDFNGQLGFGCKSAFSYTDQFTVSATKDGVTCIFVFGMDQNGVGSIVKMGETKGAVDGVTVTIPVKLDDVTRFQRTARRFYSFWTVPPEGVTVEFNYTEAPIYEFDGKKVYTDTTYGFPSTIIMGNVPYPVPDNVIEDVFAQIFNNRYVYGVPKIQIFVGMGDVQFTPSREELVINDNVKNIVKKAYEGLIAQVSDAVKTQIDSARNYLEALGIQGNLRTTYGGMYNGLGTVLYKGLPLDSYELPKTPVAYMSSRGLSFEFDKKFAREGLYYLVAPDWHIVENQPNNIYNRSVRTYGIKEKYKRGLRENLGRDKVFMIVKSLSEIPVNNNIIGIPILDMAYMDSIAVVPERGPRTPRGIGLYYYYGRGSNRSVIQSISKVAVDDEPEKGDTIYVVELDGYTPVNSGLSSMHPKTMERCLERFPHQVYAVRSGNMSRLSKKYNVIPFETALKITLIEILNSDKDASKASFSIPFAVTEDQVRCIHNLLGTDTTGYLDPIVPETIEEVNYVLTEYLRLHKAPSSLNREINALISLIGYSEVNTLILGFYDTNLESQKAVDLTKKYPLLTKLTSNCDKIEDIKDYINSMYKEKYASV